MSLVVTPAIVLHGFPYLESSRVLRLITRESGVQSVIAKGARRTRARVGSGVDLFAEGEAQIYVKPSRDLHTLGSFDVTRARAAIALDVERFTAASAIAELALRLVGADASPETFDAVSASLDAIAAAIGAGVTATAIAGAWRLVAASGFHPAIDVCASCHAPLDRESDVAFSPPTGGALCPRCARFVGAARQLPADARATLRHWLEATSSSTDDTVADPRALRAHQRLLREFVREHLGDERPLRAFAAWETGFGTVAAGGASTQP